MDQEISSGTVNSAKTQEFSGKVIKWINWSCKNSAYFQQYIEILVYQNENFLAFAGFRLCRKFEVFFLEFHEFFWLERQKHILQGHCLVQKSVFAHLLEFFRNVLVVFSRRRQTILSFFKSDTLVQQYVPRNFVLHLPER